MQKNKHVTVLKKYSEKIGTKKIKSLSDSLLRLRVSLILQKRKIEKKEESVQKYFDQCEVETYDGFLSSLEMEFNLYKYLYQNVEHK